MALGPTSSLVTLRPDLPDSMRQFDLDANVRKMVALRIAPVLEVDEALGNWGVIPLAQLLKTRDTSRMRNGEYTRGDWQFTPQTYKTVEHGTEEKVDDATANMLGNYFSSELISAARCRHIVLQGFEQRTVANALNSVGGTAACAVAWTDTVNSTPIDDVRAGQLAMWGRVGVMPQFLTVAEWDFEYLKDNAQIIDRLKYAGFQNPDRSNINEAAVAQALGLKEVIVAGAVYNSANEGQTATIASIWSRDKALLSVVAETENPVEPCYLRTFHWGGDGSSIGTAFESYRDERSRADVIRNRMQTDEQTMYAAMGQAITGLNSGTP